MRTIVTFFLLLVLPFGLGGCSLFKGSADKAKHVTYECGKGELKNLRPVAASMVKPIVAGTLTKDDLADMAIQAGEEYGGCLLANLADLIPRPLGMVGSPTEAELAMGKFRLATHSTAEYRTEEFPQ